MDTTDLFNQIYKSDGFCGVLKEVKQRLHLGRVIRKEDELYCITTGGWSDDEEIIYSLLSITSYFGSNHYIGSICGGAYYFAKDNSKIFEIKEVI